MSKESKSEFGKNLSNILDTYSTSQSNLARDMGVSRAYVSSIFKGTKNVSPSKIEEIARIVGLTEAEEIALHRSAAKDQGFKLDLPDDF